jgi:hypothetical protein
MLRPMRGTRQSSRWASCGCWASRVTNSLEAEAVRALLFNTGALWRRLIARGAKIPL